MDQKGGTAVEKNRRILRRGRVIDATGRPIAGALVSIVWGTLPTTDIARRTNDEGVFQVGIEPGRYRLQAVKSDVISEVEVEGGEGGEIIIVI